MKNIASIGKNLKRNELKATLGGKAFRVTCFPLITCALLVPIACAALCAQLNKGTGTCVDTSTCCCEL